VRRSAEQGGGVAQGGQGRGVHAQRDGAEGVAGLVHLRLGDLDGP
jgi:hypothetical protein